MTARRLRALATLALVLVLVAFAPAAARGAAQITIVNTDGPNEGFNDPTAATPVGGNTGTTVGQQRLIAFERAAEIWGQLLDTPVEIRVRASFDPLPCTADEGALGGAFPDTVVSDSPDAPLAGAWYPSALANRFAGTDLVPGSDDITARFNSSVGQTGCLENGSWYYGLDAQHGTGFDLVAVLLHELGHGLGFLTLVDDSTGSEFLNQPDIFESMIFDESAGKHWTDMTARRAGELRPSTRDHLVWDGPATHAAAPQFLGPLVALHVDFAARESPAISTLERRRSVPTSARSLTGHVAAPIDAADTAGPTTTDGCSAYTNASAIAGHVALVDRGDCTFVVKGDQRPDRRRGRYRRGGQRARGASSRNGRRRPDHHDPGPERDADRRCRRSRRISTRRRRAARRHSRAARRTGRWARPPASLRAQSRRARLLDLALGHERLAEPPDGTQPERRSPPHGRPHAAPAPRHRLDVRIPSRSPSRARRPKEPVGNGRPGRSRTGRSPLAPRLSSALSARRASRSRPIPCRKRA